MCQTSAPALSRSTYFCVQLGFICPSSNSGLFGHLCLIAHITTRHSCRPGMGVAGPVIKQHGSSAAQSNSVPNMRPISLACMRYSFFLHQKARVGGNFANQGRAVLFLITRPQVALFSLFAYTIRGATSARSPLLGILGKTGCVAIRLQRKGPERLFHRILQSTR